MTHFNKDRLREEREREREREGELETMGERDEEIKYGVRKR